MPKSFKNTRDVTDRLFIARVGWCNAYNGDPSDPPRDGGSYNNEFIGAEHVNFVDYAGRFYGYTRPKGTLKVSRVGGESAVELVSDKEVVKDTCVALIAKSLEHGQVLVGWYRHATLFAKQQHNKDRGYYQWISKANDATLLPIDQRTTVVPKGKEATGQANVAYSRDSDGTLYKDRQYLKEIRRKILGYRRSISGAVELPSNNDAIVRGQGFQHDVLYRKEIERHSMRVVGTALRKRYATVKDVSKERNFDYFCMSKRNQQRKVEVKGTTTAGDSVLVSRSEFELAESEHIDLYVVSDIIISEKQAGKSVSVTGGTLTIYSDWAERKLSSKAVGYEIVLRRKL